MHLKFTCIIDNPVWYLVLINHIWYETYTFLILHLSIPSNYLINHISCNNHLPVTMCTIEYQLCQVIRTSTFKILGSRILLPGSGFLKLGSEDDIPDRHANIQMEKGWK